MSGKENLGVLHEADSLTDLDVCLESFYNETTENHVLKNLIPPVFKVRAPHSCVLAVSCTLLALYSLKWILCYAYSKTMESWYSVFFRQLVNFLSWLFLLHPLTVVAYL
ncbi:hypothetical protein TNCT_278941 [Trichonephila clavata]|uniref:Uncharacterized protein n=1 Tax=Trichonephila clavata TaxID=2740835 RepID=A0A8X6LKQ9_TRICU|nr:hypothetical protein TNCT_278941 [Trichonephila clavata]